MLVWSPSQTLSEAKLDEYIAIAKEKHGYNMEQALGMLFWHKHNIEKSLADLPNFTPFPDEWTVEDKVLFEQAFSFHGKTFHRIQQMLPDKSIASLVKFYYSWKKTRTKTSVMDRHARKQKREREERSGPPWAPFWVHRTSESWCARGGKVERLGVPAPSWWDQDSHGYSWLNVRELCEQVLFPLGVSSPHALPALSGRPF